MPPAVLAPGQRLPRVAGYHPHSGRPLDITCHGRTSTMLLALHGNCEACTAYARNVTHDAGEFEAWDCRLLVVLDSADMAEAPWPAGNDVAIALDPDGSMRGAAIPVPAVLVADPWCELAAVLDAGAGHGFPAPEELLDWARYLGTTCPECEGEAL